VNTEDSDKHHLRKYSSVVKLAVLTCLHVWSVRIRECGARLLSSASSGRVCVQRQLLGAGWSAQITAPCLLLADPTHALSWAA
jgi:hypothetical protein